MIKHYAYCPNNIVLQIETRTAQYPDDPYPIQHFYAGGLLPFFKEIPIHQMGVVQKLWIWDESLNAFKEPKIGEEVGGEVYIGTIPKEQIWQLIQDNLTLQTKNAELADILQEVLLK